MNHTEAIAAAHAEWVCTGESPDLLPRHLAWQKLETARLEAWIVGECCGAREECGKCDSVRVRLHRLALLRDRKMGFAARSELGNVCEKSEEWALIEIAYRVREDESVKLANLAREIKGE